MDSKTGTPAQPVGPRRRGLAHQDQQEQNSRPGRNIGKGRRAGKCIEDLLEDQGFNCTDPGSEQGQGKDRADCVPVRLSQYGGTPEIWEPNGASLDGQTN